MNAQLLLSANHIELAPLGADSPSGSVGHSSERGLHIGEVGMDGQKDKICVACGASRPANGFYAGRAVCKECVKAETRNLYLANAANERERARKYYEGHREREIALEKSYRIQHRGEVRARKDRYRRLLLATCPDKLRAPDKLRHRVQDGTVIRQPCVSCGAPNAEGHHEDYSRPLDVTWLCGQCHIDLHRRRRAAMRVTKGNADAVPKVQP